LLPGCIRPDDPSSVRQLSSERRCSHSQRTTPCCARHTFAHPYANTVSHRPASDGRCGSCSVQALGSSVNAEEWDKHYATLVDAQRKVISEKRYTACRDKSVNPSFKWVKTVKTKANVQSKIPGTSRTQPATLVTARLKVQGFTLPITAHMFYEGGSWHWSMTKENLKGCTK